ncbi:hypothetical protein [Microcystis phage Mae-JY22]
MANETTWTDDSPTTVISVAANMTNGQVAGRTTMLNNAGNKRTRALATLYVSGFGSTPTAETGFELWMQRQNVDGTDDDTAGGSVTSTPASPSNGFASTQGAELVGFFPVAQTTAAQRITREIAFERVAEAHFIVRNQTGVTANAGVGTELTVKITPFTAGTT